MKTSKRIVAGFLTFIMAFTLISPVISQAVYAKDIENESREENTGKDIGKDYRDKSTDYDSLVKDFQELSSNQNLTELDIGKQRSNDILQQQISGQSIENGTRANDEYIWEEIEPNNSFSQANVLQLSASFEGNRIYGYIDEIYDVDYYRFDLYDSADIEIVGYWAGEYFKYGWEDDLFIGLLDERDEIIDFTTLVGDSEDGDDWIQYLDVSLSSGTYYIAVFSSDDYGDLYVDESYHVDIYIDDYHWVKEGNKWYYMNSSGDMQTGWEKVRGQWYYMNDSGAMQTGWTKVGGTWYYMASSGTMQTGWTKVGGTWYYMNNSGAMQTGWNKVGGTWYYMNNSGAMQTGWTKVASKWYYMNSSGAMQTGWTKVASKWYYMNNSGTMQTGWLKLGGSWYYLKSSGEMQTGRAKINNKWYVFNSSGKMR